MKTFCLFAIIGYPMFLAIGFMPIESQAFVATRPQISEQRQSKTLPDLCKLSPAINCAAVASLRATRKDGTSGKSDANSPVFAALSTERDNKPNQGNFFYNDEVISHLYGYVYLVGFFAAQDALFLGTFLVLSSASAWATQQALVPCNPRIPALTAATTLAVTVILRYGLGVELPLENLFESYEGPTESSALLEALICALNVGWGFFGTWRTKEQVNGATYGF